MRSAALRVVEKTPHGHQIGDNGASVSVRLPSDRHLMQLTISQLVLRAKQLEIESIRQLAQRVELVDLMGQLIHALQTERGMTSAYLASGGQQFAQDRLTAVGNSRAIESTLRERFNEQLEPATGATAHTLSLLAWVLLDLEAMSVVRDQVEKLEITAPDSVDTYSRLIASLVELIFHVADAARHPGISRQLVALVHLVQGKEAAGQERAVGAQLFASGLCDDGLQQRIVHLIDAQERSLQVFEEFAETAMQQRWQQYQLGPHVALLERMRRALCTAKPQAALDKQNSATWFDTTSERITELEHLQEALLQTLREYCAQQIRASEAHLHNSEDLLQQLRNAPPPHTSTNVVDRLLQAVPSAGAAPAAPTNAEASGQGATVDSATVASLVDMVQEQAARLSKMESELDAARRALNDRKVIERAKGVLMARLGMSEEVAFRTLQKASMDHNKRLVDVAEATLALPDLAFAQKKG